MYSTSLMGAHRVNETAASRSSTRTCRRGGEGGEMGGDEGGAVVQRVGPCRAPVVSKRGQIELVAAIAT